jgi:4-azaleucine resistance transporter AzlC
MAIRRAFPFTIPILLGYIPLGIAFGLMLENVGYNVIWGIVSSIFIFSGTGQFIETGFLNWHTALYEVALITVILNSRMMFYGFSFLERHRLVGACRYYLIFALTDETYALLCATPTPTDVTDRDFMLAISALNHCYWIIGGVIGVTCGALINVDSTGVDFIMTALFVVLAMDQQKAYSTNEPAIIGLFSSVSALLIFGSDKFMIPALSLIVLLLVLRRKSIEAKLGNEGGRGRESEPTAAADAGNDGRRESADGRNSDHGHECGRVHESESEGGRDE